MQEQKQAALAENDMFDLAMDHINYYAWANREQIDPAKYGISEEAFSESVRRGGQLRRDWIVHLHRDMTSVESDFAIEQQFVLHSRLADGTELAQLVGFSRRES